MSEEYDLKKSENKIGQLYPILKSKDGQIIDGFHREAADPNWKTLVVPEIDNEEKLLLARLIANFHRRQITREEKEEWINGLARIYKSQGLSTTKLVGYEFHNEIRERLEEVTGLAADTIRSYLAEEFKQESPNPLGGHPQVSPSEKVEKALGKKGAEKYRKQVLEEAKLTPQERGALTKKREHEKEERKRKREENKRKNEEKLQKQAEERAKTLKKEELIKDKDFQREVLREVDKAQTVAQQETDKVLKDLGIPPVSEQVEKFYDNLPPPKLEKQKTTHKELTNYIQGLVQRQHLKCQKCGETKIVWKCGHEFE